MMPGTVPSGEDNDALVYHCLDTSEPVVEQSREDGRDAGDENVEREGEPTGDREADPRAREAPRPRPDDNRGQIGRDALRRCEEVGDVGEERLRSCRPLAEGRAVGHEGTRSAVSCGVERQDQHAPDLLAAFRRRCRS